MPTHLWTGKDAAGTQHSIRSDATFWTYSALGVWTQVTDTPTQLTIAMLAVHEGAAMVAAGPGFGWGFAESMSPPPPPPP